MADVRCQHDRARYHCTIWRELDCQLQVSAWHDDILLERDRETHIKVEVICPDCEKHFTYNAWAHDPSSAQDWPKWLIARLIALRAHHEGVHDACTACHVPPATHPSWNWAPF